LQKIRLSDSTIDHHFYTTQQQHMCKDIRNRFSPKKMIMHLTPTTLLHKARGALFPSLCNSRILHSVQK
ncbi:MAG TPA: hypothetical protein PLN01_10995, partial [Spirochaetota bacterium]|nr:hypothetical protein [Spirochaetota bacterium]